MRVFLDISSLLKLYCKEAGTEEITRFLAQPSVSHVYLSEVASVEFSSAIWKKFRTGEIAPEKAYSLVEKFSKDKDIYQFVLVESAILGNAKSLVTKYRIEGLRTLDSIQLATCVALRREVDFFLTSDNLLKSLLQKEGLPADLPES